MSVRRLYGIVMCIFQPVVQQTLNTSGFTYDLSNEKKNKMDFTVLGANERGSVEI